MSPAEILQNERIRAMTPYERLETAFSLYKLAWQLKQSALRTAHPGWTPAEIEARTRRIFQTGYAGA